MFQYPYGDTQQLNLDWLMEQWQKTKASIDGSLQGEIDRVEAAITDLLTARDQAVAAKTAAETAATSASGYAGTASTAASTATAQATAAAGSAALAGTHASNAQTSETNAGLQATAAGNSAAAAAVSAGNASNSEGAAAASSSAAAGNALYAEGMAKGTQNGTPVASDSPYYENNAAYWAGEAQSHASNAIAASYYSEAMAKGTVNGTPVASGDPGYEDNAEYYKDQAAAQAAAAAASAASADGTNAQKMIAAPEEATSTASAAHAAGTYFRYNSKLYKATQDIALGGTITPNTNCVEDTVCAELTAQSEQIGELKTAFTDNEISTFTSPISYSRITNTSMWTNGQGIAENTGANFSDAKYCRSGFVPYTLPTVLYINSADYEFNCWAYSNNSATYKTYSPKNNYDDEPVLISPKDSSTYFRIGVRRKDGTNMSSSDVTALSTAVKTYTLTDTTLSLEGVPADAKAINSKTLVTKNSLPNGTDLNTVVTQGLYVLDGAYSYTNAPVTLGLFFVFVSVATVLQIVYPLDTLFKSKPERYYRWGGVINGVTSNWFNTYRVYNRKMACFGDSIMWGKDGTQTGIVSVDETIPDILTRALSISTENYGVSSQGYIGTASTTAYDNIASRDLTQFDTMIMCYGVNDGYKDLGTWDSTDESTIMGQFNKIINYVYTQNPTIQIIVLAPFNGTNVGTYPEYWYGPRSHPDGYVSRKTLSDTLKQACQYYWIPYIEQYDSPFNAKTITQYLPDGVHPNQAGYRVFGEWLAGKLRALIG